MPSKKQTERRFDDQIAVVTGASSGIGRRVALDLAARGATVIGLARREDLLAAVEAEMRSGSPASTTQVCDVADIDRFRGILAQAEERHGRIDILINNAGIEQSTGVNDGFGPAYREIFEVNFFAVVAGTLAVVPGMLRRAQGIVVNVASDSARAPEPGQAAYSASKAAVAAFSESVAHEVAVQGVHVHVLYPAWVPTAMGMSGVGDGAPLPPKPVRRTEQEVSAFLLGRMGGPRMEINAALLPLLAPMGRTLAPRAYQKAMQQWSQGHPSTH